MVDGWRTALDRCFGSKHLARVTCLDVDCDGFGYRNLLSLYPG